MINQVMRTITVLDYKEALRQSKDESLLFYGDEKLPKGNDAVLKAMQASEAYFREDIATQIQLLNLTWMERLLDYSGADQDYDWAPVWAVMQAILNRMDNDNLNVYPVKDERSMQESNQARQTYMTVKQNLINWFWGAQNSEHGRLICYEVNNFFVYLYPAWLDWRNTMCFVPYKSFLPRHYMEMVWPDASNLKSFIKIPVDEDEMTEQEKEELAELRKAPDEIDKEMPF